MWGFLSDDDILDVYGVNIWKFVPDIWRYWWIDAANAHAELEDVSIEHPSPIFKDITKDISDMKSGLEINTLSEIMRCCNEYLIPSVLCPWGESEYIHNCGKLAYDTVCQRYLLKCHIKKINSDKLLEKVNSSRDDYIRESQEEYDVLLLNPSWKVLPSIAFIEGKGPHVMTCREHDDGTTKSYIHPPRQPHHIIPRQMGDQLCHAVIKPRLIKPVKYGLKNNIYSMHEQRGSYQGVDTIKNAYVA